MRMGFPSGSSKNNSLCPLVCLAPGMPGMSSANIILLTLDNGLYEVTGGQLPAGAGHTDFAAMARAAGIARVYRFDTLDAWRAGAAAALTGAGPVVISLRVEGRLGQKTPKA